MKSLIRKITILCSCILLLLTIIFSISFNLKTSYAAPSRNYLTINFDDNITKIEVYQNDFLYSTWEISGEAEPVPDDLNSYTYIVTLNNGYKISSIDISSLTSGTLLNQSNDTFVMSDLPSGSILITSEPISSEQPTIPDGYRLLTKDDEGKTFGVDLEPTIYIDTNFIDDYYEWNTVTLLESPKINVDGYANDVGKFYFKDILFYNDYDSFDLSAVETINSMVLNDTITGFNDSYTGSSSSGVLAWNNFLYVKDKITEETTYSVSGAWLFNEEINYSNDFVENVQFTFPLITSRIFNTIELENEGKSLIISIQNLDENVNSYAIRPGASNEPAIALDWETVTELQVYFYNDTSIWIVSDCRYIDFGEKEQEVSEEFYNFMLENSVKEDTQEETNRITITSNSASWTVNNYDCGYSYFFSSGTDLLIKINILIENAELLQSNIFIIGTYESYNYNKEELTLIINNPTSNLSLSFFITKIPSIQTIYETSLKINLLDVIEENNSLQLKVNIPLSLTDELQLASVNISKTEELDIKNYKLTLLEEKSNEEYSIYLVENFILETGKTRFYVIPSIFRNYNETIDGEQAEGQTITEKAIEVSAKYTFEDDSKGTKVTYSGIEVITVTNKYVGFVRYENGFLSLKSSCDAHFIAFSTDLDIDKLLEADVYYTTQSYSYRKGGTIIITENETYGDINENYVHLTNGETAEYLPGGWFSQYYSWYRITSVEDFISYLKGLNIGVDDNSQLDDETMQELLKNSWVLSFAETEYYEGIINTATATNGIDKTIVGDVSILRLAFETAGEYYNLAVVDDKTEGSSEPVVTKEPDFNFWEWLKSLIESLVEKIKLIIGLVLLVLLFVVLWPILSPIISIVIKAFGFVINKIFYLLSLLFKLLIGKNKGGKRR